MAKPKKVYFVEVLRGGRPLTFREKGGGHFTQKFSAKERYDKLTRSGVNARFLETETNWKVLEEHVEVE